MADKHLQYRSDGNNHLVALTTTTGHLANECNAVVVYPCTTCTIAQPNAVVTTDAAGAPCLLDGTYIWDTFIWPLASGGEQYCLWRWTYNDGTFDYSLVVIWWTTQLVFEVSIYPVGFGMDAYYLKPAGTLNCIPATQRLTGTVLLPGLLSLWWDCTGDTATVTFGP